MKILFNPDNSNNALITIAIGDTKYAQTYLKYAYPSWEMYAKNYNLKIICLTSSMHEYLLKESLPKDLSYDPNLDYKSPYFEKYLIAKYIQKQNLGIENICYLDTDILINPHAPNIFNVYDNSKVGVVSQLKRMPYYSHHEILRKIAYLRHHYYSNSYPLDSGLFASLEYIFKSNHLNYHDDYFCAGTICLNINNHADIFFEWYLKQYATNSTVGAEEEVFLNDFVSSNNLVQWLDYRFQVQWNYEMPIKYPFLYIDFKGDQEQYKIEAKKCIQASLFDSYFLHFAGSWYEGAMWQQENLVDEQFFNLTKDFKEYCKVPVYGMPVGKITPPEDN